MSRLYALAETNLKISEVILNGKWGGGQHKLALEYIIDCCTIFCLQHLEIK